MSDFLQFKDEIIDGTAKYYITNNADGTKNIALANAIVEQGTELNKAKIGLINSVMGYNLANGEVNQLTNNIEYTTDLVLDNIQDNQIVNVKFSGDIIPPEIINIVKDKTSIGNFIPYSIEILDDENIMFLGYDSQNGVGYFSIVDKLGNIITPLSIIGNNLYTLQSTRLDNGNIFIIGTNGTKSIYFYIINQNGEIVCNMTLIDTRSYNIGAMKLIKLNNGKILVAYRVVDNTDNGYFAIINQDGTFSSSSSAIGGHYAGINALEYNNGNIIIIGYNIYSDVPQIYYCIINRNGNIIKTTAQLGQASSHFSIHNISNDRVLCIIESLYSSGDRLIAYIINNDGTIYDQKTIISSQYRQVDSSIFEFENGNYLITDGKYNTIINDNLELIKNSYEISTTFERTKSIIRYNDTFISYSMKLENLMYNVYYCIYKYNGTIIKERTLLSDNFGANGSILVIAKLESGEMILANRITNGTTHIANFIIPKYSPFIVLLNNIEIDTLPNHSRLYELLYSENHSKFIAEEVRNAN